MKHFISTIILLFFVLSLQAQICVGDPGKVQWECWRNLYGADFSELSAIEFYPKTPDVTQTIYSLNAPLNYDNNFGARITGFIHVPVTDSVTFNITGNRRARFFLSTNDSPANLVLRAFTNEFTNELEHTKYPEQTSVKLLLQANQYYYFEMIYVDDSGGDHCRLFWKNSFISNTTWNGITAAYLNDVGCKADPCPPRGTACDDGNALTTDDLQDGHCNCIGKPNSSNTCVGTRDYIKRFRYDNIAGSTLNDLYAASGFPAVPSTSFTMPLLGTKSESQINNSGHLVHGFLTVPVSGNYKFNVTGDDMTILFLSNNDDPENKQSHQVLVTGWTNMTEHNKYVYQSTSNIYLQAGQFYYIEINHKEGTGSEHFGAFWQTPFTGPGVWKRIPSFYMYDYDCTLACIPQGTICDDGNPFTNSDQYNDNCECEGIPCSGPECDSPLANYVPFEKCNVTDQLANRASNNWLSCQISDNPNPDNERSHWIKYDLGERHQLISSHIWNYNVENETQNGFQSVLVDYSDDGVTWENMGLYNWPLASGESSYGGFIGPDLTGVFARYLLFTSMDDTTSCRGIGKVAFKAIFCPTAGTVCDDNNPLTINDMYNTECVCAGVNPLQNECDELNLNLGTQTLYTDVFSAIEKVTSTSVIDPESFVGFVGGESVILNPGFETMSNAVFIASIDSCESGSLTIPPPSALTQLRVQPTKMNEISGIQVRYIADSDLVEIQYYISKPGIVKLFIQEANFKKHILAEYEHLNKGIYKKIIRTKKLSQGVHQVSLIASEQVINEKIIVGQGERN
ncbi:MAG: hypothetical protein IPM42_09535 [Saprospiraceae bacterium]|nr:hypothetical protein [Saprospiraceae bacterium]